MIFCSYRKLFSSFRFINTSYLGRRQRALFVRVSCFNCTARIIKKHTKRCINSILWLKVKKALLGITKLRRKVLKNFFVFCEELKLTLGEFVETWTAPTQNKSSLSQSAQYANLLVNCLKFFLRNNQVKQLFETSSSKSIICLCCDKEKRNNPNVHELQF